MFVVVANIVVVMVLGDTGVDTRVNAVVNTGVVVVDVADTGV